MSHAVHVSKLVLVLSAIVLASSSEAVASALTVHHRRKAPPTCTARHSRRAPRCGARSRPTESQAVPVSVASVAPCANSALVPDQENISVTETATLCLVNQARGEYGLTALLADADLQGAAEAHDLDMVDVGYFENTGRSGESLLSRIELSGYLSGSAGYVLGENIARASGYLATPAAIVSQWVDSPGSLANILAPYADVGTAIVAQALGTPAAGPGGALYTQDFGRTDQLNPRAAVRRVPGRSSGADRHREVA